MHFINKIIDKDETGIASNTALCLVLIKYL